MLSFASLPNALWVSARMQSRSSGSEFRCRDNAQNEIGPALLNKLELADTFQAVERMREILAMHLATAWRLYEIRDSSHDRFQHGAGKAAWAFALAHHCQIADFVADERHDEIVE